MSVLDEFRSIKQAELARRKAEEPESALRAKATAALPAKGFGAAIAAARARTGRPALIAEVKKGSPSKGIIAPEFDHIRVARAYIAAGAACVSVLTEEERFLGSLRYLREIAMLPGAPPLLRKDFVIDPYQLLEARANGASAVLLIAAMLGTAELRDFRGEAEGLGMDALVEVHDEAELESAIESGAKIIGVNNRDLGTFEVDLGTSMRLAPRIPAGVLRVAESGIASPAEREALGKAGFDALLVGETLMRAPDPAEAARAFCA